MKSEKSLSLIWTYGPLVESLPDSPINYEILRTPSEVPNKLEINAEALSLEDAFKA